MRILLFIVSLCFIACAPQKKHCSQPDELRLSLGEIYKGSELVYERVNGNEVEFDTVPDFALADVKSFSIETNPLRYDTVYGALFTIHAQYFLVADRTDTSKLQLKSLPYKLGRFAYAVYEVTSELQPVPVWSIDRCLHFGLAEKRKLLKIYVDDEDLDWYERLIDLTKYYEFIPEDQF